MRRAILLRFIAPVATAWRIVTLGSKFARLKG
jgi:hypothetical protein